MALTTAEAAMKNYLNVHDMRREHFDRARTSGARVRSIEEAVAFIDLLLVHETGEKVRALVGTGEDITTVFEGLAASLRALAPLRGDGGPLSPSFVSVFSEAMAGGTRSLRLA